VKSLTWIWNNSFGSTTSNEIHDNFLVLDQSRFPFLYTVADLLDLEKDFLFVQCCGSEMMFSDPNPALSLILDPDLDQDLDPARFQSSILDAKLQLHLSSINIWTAYHHQDIVKKSKTYLFKSVP
jgi:hypothetical protein